MNLLCGQDPMGFQSASEFEKFSYSHYAFRHKITPNQDDLEKHKGPLCSAIFRIS